MMHANDIVISLVDDSKKPLREHDFQKEEFSRKAKVFLPFDTEYKILIKNQSDRRIKLDVEIDGTNVSAEGLIILPHTADYLERFVNIAKKFKFVRSNNEAVADPSNRENGIVKVRVVKENCAYFTPNTQYIPTEKEVHHHHHYHYDTHEWPWRTPPASPMWPQNPIIWCGNTNVDNVVSSTMRGTSLSPINPLVGGEAVYSCNVSQTKSGDSLSASNSVLRNKSFKMPESRETGATIEGGYSDQNFTTTIWSGDLGQAIIYTFTLFGFNVKEDEEYKKYLELKKKFD